MPWPDGLGKFPECTKQSLKESHSSYHVKPIQKHAPGRIRPSQVLRDVWKLRGPPAPSWEVPNGGLTNGGVRATCEEIVALWKATSLAKAPKATPCYKMTHSAALRTTTCNKMQISELDRGLYQKNTQGYKTTGFVTPPFVTPPFGTG